MRAFLFLTLFLGPVLGWRPSFIPPIWDESCKFDRENLVQCVQKKVDKDHDGYVTLSEVKYMISQLPFLIRHALPAVVSVDQIFQGCDYNGDGYITADDFRRSKNTCLPRKRYLCTAEWLCS